MTQGHNIGRFLRGHDPCDPRHGEHVALLDASRCEQLGRCRVGEVDAAFGGCEAVRDAFGGDWSHVHGLRGREVREGRMGIGWERDDSRVPTVSTVSVVV
jgi:hypothetical protein